MVVGEFRLLVGEVVDLLIGLVQLLLGCLELGLGLVVRVACLCLLVVGECFDVLFGLSFAEHGLELYLCLLWCGLLCEVLNVLVGVF